MHTETVVIMTLIRLHHYSYERQSSFVVAKTFQLILRCLKVIKLIFRY